MKQTNLIDVWNRTGDDEKIFRRQSKRRRDQDHDDHGSASKRLKSTAVFDGLCFYINASTAPLVSDHRLKHLIAEHGGRVAPTLARRSVTHVVLSRPISPSSFSCSNSLGEMRGKGCGGGLAAGKYQKEIGRLGGAQTVKYVAVEW